MCLLEGLVLKERYKRDDDDGYTAPDYAAIESVAFRFKGCEPVRVPQLPLAGDDRRE